ncbi:MAG: hypothetical protein M1826_000920 [Phylliscum demangeonii]|nr:MAG: hypothetical protein M1826_000920 [Phylliscum demangeonii]
MSGLPASRNRLPLYLGAGVVAVGGFYLYMANGNAKLAEKKFGRDAARVGSAIKSELPGQGTVYKKNAEEIGVRTGATIDHAIDETKAKLVSAEQKLEQYGRETGRELSKKIDEADKKIEETAAKTKSGLSSLFSSGNK